MKLLKLRKQLNEIGLVLLKHGKHWMVTDNGTKTPIEKEFVDLEAVQLWLDSPARRLSELESDEFDAEWAEWCLTENRNWRK